MTVDDYFEFENFSPIRHEFINGEIYAKSGSTANHNRIATNLLVILDSKIKYPDEEVFGLSLKLKVTENIFYYPDVFVVCDKNPESSFYRKHPLLVVEVISPSTEHIDRREKLLFYQQIPSLQEYIVIEQKKIAIEIHRRQPNGGWITYYFDDSDDEVEFQSIDMTLAIDEIYRRVKFED